MSTAVNVTKQSEKRTTDDLLLAREGWPIISLSLGLSLVAFVLYWPAGIVLALWTLFCLYFFRNPSRQAPLEEGAIVCPADGTIIQISEETEPDFIHESRQRVTIFMSPFNVHVNRLPVDGKVLNETYHQGRFKAAFDKEASSLNERHAVFFETKDGDQIVFVQIAGWFARRIVNYLKAGVSGLKGDIFGVILFGSRMDVYLPASYKVDVKLKQKVKAGETILAKK